MTVPTTTDCSDECPWFEAIINLDAIPTKEYKAWAKQITQCKNKIFLPDGTHLDYKLFMDSINNAFKNNDFNNYLNNRYNESLL